MRIKYIYAIALAFILILPAISGCIYISGELPGLSSIPLIQTFEAAPAVIAPGEYSTLTWSVTGASQVHIDNNVGNVALKGNVTVSPGVATHYTLTATNAAGKTTARTQVLVSGPASQQLKPAVIRSFSADKTTINPGEAVTLSWNTAEATLVSLEPGGPVSPQGSMTVYPGVTSDYTLTASNASGTVQNKLTLTVAPSGGYQDGSGTITTLTVVRDESGSLVKNNTVYTYQEKACAGDTSLNLASRAFLSFDISSIPRNAVIEEAMLDLSSYSIEGNPSYTGSPMVQGTSMVSGMGALEIYFFPYGGLSDLGTMAYNRPAVLIKGGNITDYPVSPWVLDVKTSALGEQTLQDLVTTGRPRCQFRIQFFTSTNWDMVADILCFDGAKLILRYTVP